MGLGSILLLPGGYTPHRRTSSTLELESSPTIIHDLSPGNVKSAYLEFCQILGDDKVSVLDNDLLSHSGSDYQSYDWSEETAQLGHIVVYPSNTDEVSQIARVCHRRHIPLTPYSGGTSIEGQYIPTRGGICVDFSSMSSIISINPTDLDCTVQPGLGWMDLNSVLEESNLFFPPDPGPGAMIGGMIGTGCSGTNAAAYGTMKDWVLSLTVVLADGTIVKTRQRPRKSSAGYDLTRTFIGSEGTLGLVTEATLKLAVKPRNEIVAVCTFPTVRHAAATVQEIVSRGIQTAAVEILDDVQMRSINEAKSTSRKWREEPSLFFKFNGVTELASRDAARLVETITTKHGSTSFVFASSDEERSELWSARKAALWSMLALKKSPSDKVWITDVAVPLSRLADIVEETQSDIKQSGLLGSIVGHVGDGNFHTLILFSENQRDTAEGLVHRMVDMAIEMEGTVSGEHGIGLVKRDYLEAELGSAAVNTMRMVCCYSVCLDTIQAS
jgi:D-lactate dehydrogenase (cytochrome)